MASMNFDYKVIDFCGCGTGQPSEIGLPRIPYGNNLEEEESRTEPKKCRYRSGVLVGNWFERRATYEPEPDDWVTVHDTTYTCKVNEDKKKDRSTYEDIQRKARGLGAEYLINHQAGAFTKNYTTTNELHYRVFPLGLCGPRRRKYSSRLDLWVPEIDLAKDFGNLTETGLNEWIRYQNQKESIPSPRESMHTSQFKYPVVSAESRSEKRFPRGKGIPNVYPNEPHLEHLDIDPNQPFRPHILPIKT